MQGVGSESDTTKGKLRQMADGRYEPFINVTDRGTARAVQALINGISGKEVTVVARLQRTAALQAYIGGSLAGNQSGLPRSAAGGLFTNPTTRLIGESGPEAVIPLARPLGSVDRSVRNLTALIRGGGKNVAASVSGSGSGGGRTVNITMNVTPLQADPESVAESVMNRAVALAR